MKYNFKLLRGPEILMDADIETAPGPLRTTMLDMDTIMFNVEQAINAHTNVRAHINRIEPEETP
jgi:hypothetical protein